jgi:heme/copper-type cytochrome/quinol oxidase subunit 2
VRGIRRSNAPWAIACVALLALAACGDGGTRGAGITPIPPPTGSGTLTQTATPPPIVEATEIAIVVKGGQVESPGEVGVSLGDRIRIRVRADVTDEVHVHSYDLLTDVSPGHSATIEFTADVAGVFEVELEGAGLLLLRLKVSP